MRPALARGGGGSARLVRQARGDEGHPSPEVLRVPARQAAASSSGVDPGARSSSRQAGKPVVSPWRCRPASAAALDLDERQPRARQAAPLGSFPVADRGAATLIFWNVSVCSSPFRPFHSFHSIPSIPSFHPFHSIPFQTSRRRTGQAHSASHGHLPGARARPHRALARASGGRRCRTAGRATCATGAAGPAPTGWQDEAALAATAARARGRTAPQAAPSGHTTVPTTLKPFGLAAPVSRARLP